MKTKRSLRTALALLCLLPAVTSAAPPGIVNHQGRIAVGGVNHDGTGHFKFALVGPLPETVSRASAMAVINGGFVTSIDVTGGGSGYDSPPTVTLSGGGGSGATATAVVTGGVVTSITVDSPGSGFSNIPGVAIAPPPVPTGTFWTNDGTPVGDPGSAVEVAVSKGHYTIPLGDTSFHTNMTNAVPADIFAERDDLRLRVWFATDAGGPFEQLTPDRRLTTTGYAFHAAQATSVADGAVHRLDSPDGSLTGIVEATDDGKTIVKGPLQLDGSLLDASASAGTNGQVLSKAGAGTDWISLLDNSPHNELQQLDFDGTSLTLSDGGGDIEIITLAKAIPEGVIDATMLAPDSVGSSQVMPNSLTAADLATNSVDSAGDRQQCRDQQRDRGQRGGH